MLFKTAMSISAVIVLAGCAAGGRSGAHASGRASDERRAATFDQVKQLEGAWETKDEKGQWRETHNFHVSSNGSIVREVMFAGTPHEMTNIYHMDGNDLVVTHYCAMGNQPVMKATTAKPGELDFTFDHITNMSSPDQMYMGQMNLVWVDKDHVKQGWKTLNAKETDHESDGGMVFELRRKS